MTHRVGKLAVLWVTVIVLVCGCHRDAPTNKDSRGIEPSHGVERAWKSLVELDVEGARTTLGSIKERGVAVDQLRARLALMVGDCQGALTLLSVRENQGVEASGSSTPRRVQSEIYPVAEGCARAMAGAEIITDEARGVWVRLQNSHDRALVPLVTEVVARASAAISADLRATLPRPVRIELVSDLASLAAVTGLPLEAAETTGTIAIARWGKVTLVSPRATPTGYPWQDTLAHELAHLIVSQKSGDAAPLWLQEGIAKREENRWREPLPLDDANEAHREAKSALLEGRSIGIDRLGASMALLPTPKAADTAYAEVRDFLEFWLSLNGEFALQLLLRDLAGLGPDSVDRALVSVSGYPLQEWILRWQTALREESPRPSTLLAATSGGTLNWTMDAARHLRLAELFEERRHYSQALEQLTPLLDFSRMPPEVANASAHVRLMLGQVAEARSFVEPPERVTHLDGTWLAIRGRVLGAMGESAAAEVAFQQSLAFAPTLEKVACRGFSQNEQGTLPTAIPTLEPWRSLCRSARSAFGDADNSGKNRLPGAPSPWID